MLIMFVSFRWMEGPVGEGNGEASVQRPEERRGGGEASRLGCKGGQAEGPPRSLGQQLAF